MILTIEKLKIPKDINIPNNLMPTIDNFKYPVCLYCLSKRNMVLEYEDFKLVSSF
ncbi:hypothetical protein ACUW9H_002352, partial [Staphylococcus capitis]